MKLKLQKTLAAGATAIVIMVAGVGAPAHAGNGVIADIAQPAIGKPAADALGALHRAVGKPLDRVAETTLRKPVKWAKKRLGIK